MNFSRTFPGLPACAALSVDFTAMTTGQSLRGLTRPAFLSNIFSSDLFRIDFDAVYCLLRCVPCRLKLHWLRIRVELFGLSN